MINNSRESDFSNNCFFDSEKKNIIPQNENSFYRINVSTEWRHALDVFVNTNEKINILNLFLIVKSLTHNKFYFPYSISIVVKNEHKNLVMENVRINFLVKINLIEFEEWINFRIYYDSKYISKDSFYSIRFLYEKKLITDEQLDQWKPIYPWNDQILDQIKNHKLTIHLLQDELNKQKKKIKELEDSLKIFKNK